MAGDILIYRKYRYQTMLLHTSIQLLLCEYFSSSPHVSSIALLLLPHAGKTVFKALQRTVQIDVDAVLYGKRTYASHGVSHKFFDGSAEAFLPCVEQLLEFLVVYLHVSGCDDQSRRSVYIEGERLCNSLRFASRGLCGQLYCCGRCVKFKDSRFDAILFKIIFLRFRLTCNVPPNEIRVSAVSDGNLRFKYGNICQNPIHR